MSANPSPQADPSAATVHCALSDGLAVVTLHNVAQRNALTRSMCHELASIFTSLDASDHLSAVVLRGAAGTFCAGIAITEFRDVMLDGEEGGELRDHLTQADAAIRACRFPVIAAVEGFCFGGGWQLASACDWVVASADARFAITPSKLGIVYPRVGMQRLVKLAGPASAKYLLATGFGFGADRALAYGLVADVFPPEEFELSLARLTSALAIRSQFSIWATNRLIDAAESGSAGLDDLWGELWATMATGPDIDIGLQSFIDHEEPSFTWRARDSRSRD